MDDSAKIEPTDHQEFVRLFSRHQRQIYAYIGTVLANPGDVEEVLQETSIILWEKFSTFRRDESFVKWACGVAHLQILRFFRQQKRRMLPLDSPTIEALLAEREEMEDELALQRTALTSCLKKLRGNDREIVSACYAPGTKFKDVAAELGRSVGALYHSLGRIRRTLHDCIHRHISSEQHG
jgi:RNA polymerase sigma-70 factor (ECF subfamily)